MLKMHKRNKAANKLAAAYRSSRQRRVYVSFLRSIVLLQSSQRRKEAIERARKLRDPYCDLTFQECKKALKIEEGRLEKAVASKDFKAAAELEVKM